MQEEMST